jgi:hypothetical protein
MAKETPTSLKQFVDSPDQCLLGGLSLSFRRFEPEPDVVLDSRGGTLLEFLTQKP